MVYRKGPFFNTTKWADLDRNSGANKKRSHMGYKNSCEEGTVTMAGQLYFPFVRYDSATRV